MEAPEHLGRWKPGGSARGTTFGLSSLGVALLLVGALALPATTSAAGTPFTPLPGSATAGGKATGSFHSRSMSITVVLAPRNDAQLQSLLAGQQSAASPNYHHWLTKGQFAARFAPSAAERARRRALPGRSRTGRDRGSSSPFLIRAVGSSARVAGAFRTELRTYRGAKGTAYFSNASAIQLPAGLARDVLGVVGLTNTIRLHANAVRIDQPHRARRPSARTANPDCETPYPTVRSSSSSSTSTTTRSRTATAADRAAAASRRRRTTRSTTRRTREPAARAPA